MLKRTISALVALPLLFIVLFLGGDVLIIATAIISIIGLYEFYNAFNLRETKLPLIGYLMTVGLFVGLFFEFSTEWFTFISTVLVLTVLGINVFTKKYTLYQLVLIITGFYYVPVLLSHLVLLYRIDINDYYIWLPFMLAWISDTCAYFFGKLFGKTPLIEVSPKKTLEGSIAGILGTTIFITIYSYILMPEFVFYSILLGITGGVLSQIGDLIASKIKRTENIKDFGNIMPGHGGVLDRFDSIIVTIPLVYYVIVLFNFLQ